MKASSFKEKKWFQKNWDNGAADSISSELNIHPAIASILVQRGLTNTAEARSFLYPTLADLAPPFLMKGMNEATALISDAITNRIPFIIYGDYDVDGATGMAVLALFLRKVGVEVICCQPDRLIDGYGFHANVIREIQSKAKKYVVITVDCGITDVDDVKEVKEMGYSVIVTDHHTPSSTLPPADAILNPLQPGCTFPFKFPAGVGVAFYLVMGLRNHLNKHDFWKGRAVPNLKALLDLVAVGTISDMVPLQSINRVLTKAGLEVLSTTDNLGLRSLMEISGVNRLRISAEDISFRIGPRINAAGRTGDPQKAIELLTTDSASRAKELAKELDFQNNQRKLLEKEVYDAAFAIAKDQVLSGKCGLVLSGDGWHPGVIGIVASRIMNQFNRPVILITVVDGLAKGSGRSTAGMNLLEVLTNCAELLEGFGGHKSAAGLSMLPEHIESFTKKFNSIVTEMISKEDLMPKLMIDTRLNVDEILNKSFFDALYKLEPFGMGNPEPVFQSNNSWRIWKPRVVGTNHLKFFLKENGSILNAIGFGFGHLVSNLETDPRAELAFNLRLNEFRGKTNRQINLVDIRTASTV
ncbi:MAG: single-stranded-DNA-specific exonuclease RecJ [Thermodesulfobacteriota bacterium]|nr:single-stranded-DNA-specific exonuclease RecJ [Thermodesulfobacteriota bacterium]